MSDTDPISTSPAHWEVERQPESAAMQDALVLAALYLGQAARGEVPHDINKDGSHGDRV